MELTAKYEVILEEREGPTLKKQEKFFSQFPIYTQNNKIFQLRIVGGQTELFEINRADLFNKQFLVDEGTQTAKSAEDIFAAGQVAKVGGGQDAANALTTAFIRVITVASTGDSITLQVAKNNREIVVFNSGLNTLAVFPFTGGTFDGGAANASVNVPAGTVVKFIGTSATNWDLAVSGSGTLAAILGVGNSTGANDINITAGRKIISGNIEFGFNLFSSDDIFISNDSGAGAKAQIFMDTSVSTFQWASAGVLVAQDGSAAGVSGVEGIRIQKNIANDAVSRNADNAVGVFINARNSTINSGIDNSVVIAANGVTATASNTLYTGALKITGNSGFYNQNPVAKPTGVAVSSAGIHAALVTLNLIAA